MKKVLFIYGSFYEYSSRIIDILNLNGFSVDSFSSTLFLNYFEKIINTISFRKNYISNIKYKKHNKKLLMFINKLENNYDYVFILNGRFLEPDLIKFIKEKNKKAKFILYLWDSIRNIKNTKERFSYFDNIYSFDSIDCEKNQLSFLPLFYTTDFREYSTNKINDIFYCVNLHSERVELLKKIVNFSQNNNLTIEAKILISYWRFFYYNLINLSFRKYKEYFTCQELSLNDFAKHMCSSRVCVDMQHKLQTGLTMRCIEALPAQTKIITTNEHIKEYDFYCPENVMIIDRENPVFDVDFIKSPYKPLPKEIVEKYSLENWIKTIFKE